MAEAVAQLIAGSGLEEEAGSDTRAERQQLLSTQLVEQAAIAGEHDAEDGARVEAGRGEDAQLVEDAGVHLLSFVDQQNRPGQGGNGYGPPGSADS